MMSNDEWNADAAADPPGTAYLPGGEIGRLSGTVWQEAPTILGDLQREADTYRNLFPDADQEDGQ